MHATRYYSHGGQIVGLRVEKGHVQWMSTDHHGTGQWIVNGGKLTVTARKMDAFGNQRGENLRAWPDERGFVGGIDNPGSNLTSIGAREYDSEFGRFITRDPIRLFNDPQQVNGYAYANNNPVAFNDSTGLLYGTGYSCIDGDCSYHNSDGTIKTKDECKTSVCGKGAGSAPTNNGKSYSGNPVRPGPKDSGSLDPNTGCDALYGCNAPRNECCGGGSDLPGLEAPPRNCPAGDLCYSYTYELQGICCSQEWVSSEIISNFDHYFPFATDCDGALAVGIECALWLEVLPKKNPIYVEGVGDHSFQFVSLQGHSEGADRRIRFSIIDDRQGGLFLQVDAWGPSSFGAEVTVRSGLAENIFWQDYANNIGGWINFDNQMDGRPNR
jgi:RHS repeat-associated protein